MTETAPTLRVGWSQNGFVIGDLVAHADLGDYVARAIGSLMLDFTALINCAASFLLQETPLRLDVSAERPQAPG